MKQLKGVNAHFLSLLILLSLSVTFKPSCCHFLSLLNQLFEGVKACFVHTNASAKHHAVMHNIFSSQFLPKQPKWGWSLIIMTFQP
jgi:hypothetical protein